MNIRHFYKLIRPHQWLKNFFVFLPIFFSGNLFDKTLLIKTILVFFSFCFISSSVYCFNDIIDKENDKKHSQKKFRPIASGEISVFTGFIIMAVMLAFSYIIMFFSNFDSYIIGIITLYFVINILYTLKLKQFPIIDVFIIAIGFVLRILSGGFAGKVYVSHWLVLMTFLLALFIAFAKRRDDVVKYEDTKIISRKNILSYNLDFLDQTISVIASITMVCYIMYTVSPEVTSRFNSNNIYITSIFVLAGIIRYLQIAIVNKKSGDPTKVLMKDRFIQICIMGWVILFGYIIY